MFVIPRVNVIQSDEGFSVEILDLTRLVYTEGSKSLDIDSEVLAGPAGLAIYKDSIQSWNPPHGGDTIDEAERDAIVENIRRAFRFQGFEIHVL